MDRLIEYVSEITYYVSSGTLNHIPTIHSLAMVTPPPGKKLGVLRNNWPCYCDWWHTGLKADLGLTFVGCMQNLRLKVTNRDIT